jgi:hypothetical protein
MIKIAVIDNLLPPIKLTFHVWSLTDRARLLVLIIISPSQTLNAWSTKPTVCVASTSETHYARKKQYATVLLQAAAPLLRVRAAPFLPAQSVDKHQQSRHNAKTEIARCCSRIKHLPISMISARASQHSIITWINIEGQKMVPRGACPSCVRSRRLRAYFYGAVLIFDSPLTFRIAIHVSLKIIVSLAGSGPFISDVPRHFRPSWLSSKCCIDVAKDALDNHLFSVKVHPYKHQP